MTLSFSELMRRIGDDNITFQLLLPAITSVQAVSEKKFHATGMFRVTFITNGITPNDVLGPTPEHCFMLVKVPQSRLDEAMRNVQ